MSVFSLFMFIELVFAYIQDSKCLDLSPLCHPHSLSCLPHSLRSAHWGQSMAHAPIPTTTPHCPPGMLSWSSSPESFHLVYRICAVCSLLALSLWHRYSLRVAPQGKHLSFLVLFPLYGTNLRYMGIVSWFKTHTESVQTHLPISVRCDPQEE